MFIQKPLTAERRSLSERQFLSLENAEKQHLVQTAEGEVLRQESGLLKHPGEPQACISEKTMESDSSCFSFRSYHWMQHQNSYQEVTMREYILGNDALHSTAYFFITDLRIWLIWCASITRVVLKRDSDEELQLLSESCGWIHNFKRKSENTILKQTII